MSHAILCTRKGAGIPVLPGHHCPPDHLPHLPKHPISPRLVRPPPSQSAVAHTMWPQLGMSVQGWPELSCCCPALKAEKHHTDWKAAGAGAVVCQCVPEEHPGQHARGRNLERACRIAMQHMVGRVSQYTEHINWGLVMALFSSNFIGIDRLGCKSCRGVGRDLFVMLYAASTTVCCVNAG